MVRGTSSWRKICLDGHAGLRLAKFSLSALYRTYPDASQGISVGCKKVCECAPCGTARVCENREVLRVGMRQSRCNYTACDLHAYLCDWICAFYDWVRGWVTTGLVSAVVRLGLGGPRAWCSCDNNIVFTTRVTCIHACATGYVHLMIGCVVGLLRG